MDFLPWIQARIRSGRYVISRHAEIERFIEDIDVENIEMSILNGILVEDYPEDKRGRSALIAGPADFRWIHVVCGRKGDWVIIITVYLPKPPHWETPVQRGES